jgi:tRNA dimethylallyltransferase
MNKYLIVIVGPTAIGKTALSISLANHFQTEILSTDSRQIFKEMTIGTAVPNKKELNSAIHHFIQNKSIFDKYSVGDYELESIELLSNLYKKHKVVIAVGGSGLYVNALLNGLDDFPDIKPGIREEIIKNYESLGLTYLQDTLQKYDSNYFKIIAENNPQTLQNPQRLMRFIEVCISSDQPYSSFINKEKNQRDFTPIIIGLQANRDILYNRINQRVDLMMNEGLLEEAKILYPHKTLNALQTVGYKELFTYFNHELTLDDSIEKIKQNTRNFAKRQITWFNKTENVKWFDYQEDIEAILNHINDKINA